MAISPLKVKPGGGKPNPNVVESRLTVVHKTHPIAKLTMPQAAGAVRRERLFRALDEMRTRFPAVWISAPGGAGKTILVSSYLRDKELPCLWFQMDAADSDPSGFFHYLGQAVARAAPRQRKPMPSFTAEYQGSGPVFAQRYFEEMGRRLAARTAIVFDNCEAVPADSSLWPLLTLGLRFLPPGIDVILNSRHEPPPAFAGLTVNGRVGALGWEDLKVSLVEAELIGAQQGRSPIEARQLHARSGGWMAALVVMFEQMRRGGDAALLQHDSPQALFDFFSHDIFARMPADTRALLLKTAFLPHVSVAAAERISQNPAAGRILAQMCRHNLFTERLAGSAPVYQYHPLFRDFLKQQCETLFSAAEIADIKNTSAAVTIDAGNFDAAIPLLAEAGAFSAALELLLAQAPTFINQGRNQTFLALLDLLPQDLTQPSPACNFWRGVAMQPFGPAAARTHFVLAFELFKEADDMPGMLRCWSAVVETIFHEWDNFTQADPWVAWLTEVAHGEFAISDPTLDVQVSSAMTAALTMRGGDPKSMRRWAERTIRALKLETGIYPRLSALVYCANYFAWVQPLDLDTAIAETSLRDAERADLPPILRLTTIYTRAALTLHRAPDMKPVLDDVRSALALADEAGVHVWDEIFCGLGVYAAAVLRERSASAAFVEKMRQCVSPQRRQGLAFYYYIRAWNNLVFGSIRDARAEIDQALHLYEQTGYEFPSNVAWYGAAVIYAACGEMDTALAHATRADATAEKYEARAMRYTTLLCLAYVRNKRGETQATLKALRAALHIGKEGGYYLTLWWWYAPMMSALAALALQEDIEREHVVDLVRRLKLNPPDPLTTPASWPWPIRINTLGRFEVLVDGQALDMGKKSGQKPLALLKMLCAHSHEGVSAGHIADALWPGGDGDKAQHALEMALHRIRKMLGNDEAVQTRDGKVRMNPALCRIDAHTFVAGIEAGLHALGHGKRDEALAVLDSTVALYAGPFLAGDKYAEQVLAARERLRTRFLLATEKLCALHESAGQTEMALDLYRRASEVVDLSEELCRGYMRCCQQLGKRSEALDAYTRLERTMRSTRLSPSTETLAVLEALSGAANK